MVKTIVTIDYGQHPPRMRLILPDFVLRVTTCVILGQPRKKFQSKNGDQAQILQK